MVCRMQEWLLSIAGLLILQGKACALNNSYTLRDVLMICGIHVC